MAEIVAGQVFKAQDGERVVVLHSADDHVLVQSDTGIHRFTRDAFIEQFKKVRS